MRRTVSGICAALWLIALVACGTDGSAASPTSTPLLAETAAPTPTPVARQSEFSEILLLMPDTAESRTYTLVSRFQEIATRLGIEIPGPDATTEEVAQYRMQLALRSLETGVLLNGKQLLAGFHMEYIDGIPDTRPSLGFGSGDISVAAIAGEAHEPPLPLTEVVIGQIDPEEAQRLLDECSECAAEPMAVMYEGAQYYAWGHDFMINPRASLSPPLFDRLGRGGRLYFGDGFAARTLRTQDMESVIAVTTGSVRSLADNEEWALAAEAMADLDALAAVFTEMKETSLAGFPSYRALDQVIPPYFSEGTATRLENYDEIAAEVTASAPPLPEHELVATGTGFENGLSFAALAIVYADESTAETAATALEARASGGLAINGDLTTKPWSDLIESIEIVVEGRVVKVKVVPAVDPGQRPRSLELAPFLATYPFVTAVPYVVFLLR